MHFALFCFRFSTLFFVLDEYNEIFFRIFLSDDDYDEDDGDGLFPPWNSHVLRLSLIIFSQYVHFVALKYEKRKNHWEGKGTMAQQIFGEGEDVRDREQNCI